MRPPSAPRRLEGLLHQARAERLLPGDGGLDLRGILRAAPAPTLPFEHRNPMETREDDGRRRAVGRRLPRQRASLPTDLRARLRQIARSSGDALVADIEAAARNVYAAMSPTPQYAWPLLAQRAGCEVWVKHENHTPTGAFKVRGGLNLLAQAGRAPTADSFPASSAQTRGNHGQSLAFAARRHGVRCRIVVPQGNSPTRTRRCARSAPS